MEALPIAAAILCGMLAGAFSGLLPGLHSNTIASIASLLPIPLEPLSIFIISSFAAHLCFSFFPSIFLGAPDENTVQSVLPGHRMMLDGRGLYALQLCTAAVALAGALSLLLFPLSGLFLSFVYPLITPYMLPFLLLASAILLASEGDLKRAAKATLVFLLCGALGMLTMNIGMREPLFSVFSGLFAVSGLLIAAESGEKMPKQQKPSGIKIELRYVLLGVLLGMLADLFPGLASPAQIAVFATFLVKMEDARHYLTLIASIAASHAVFAFSAAANIGKAREGSLAIVNNTLGISTQNVLALLGIFILSLSLCCLALILLSSLASRFNFSRLSSLRWPIIIYLALMSLLMNGPMGLLVLFTSSCLGVLPVLLGVRRTHVMGSIIVPSMVLLF